MATRKLEKNRIVLTKNGQLPQIKDYLIGDAVLTTDESMTSRCKKQWAIKDKTVNTTVGSIIVTADSAKIDMSSNNLLIPSPVVSVRTGEVKGKEPTCDKHSQPLSLYCSICVQPICTECIHRHDGHVMQALSTAFENNKSHLEKEVDLVRSMKANLEAFQKELLGTQQDIMKMAEEECNGVEVNYKLALRSLNAWKKLEMEKVEAKRDELTRESDSWLKKINQLIENADGLMKSFKEILSGNNARFLLESKQLLERLKRNSSEGNQAMEAKGQKMTELQSALNRFDFRPCILTSLQARTLDFTEASKQDAVIIEALGLTVKDKPGVSAFATGVRTDGLLSESQYWEVAVTWGVSSPASLKDNWLLVCIVGVRQEGSNFSSTLGRDPTSYGVDIVHTHARNSYRFDCGYQGKVDSSSKEQVLQDDSANHRFGFLLQTPERTLAVIDLDTETRLHTFRELDVSRPYVPAVWFASNFFHRSFRLIPSDSTISLKRVLAIVNS